MIIRSITEIEAKLNALEQTLALMPPNSPMPEIVSSMMALRWVLKQGGVE